MFKFGKRGKKKKWRLEIITCEKDKLVIKTKLKKRVEIVTWHIYNTNRRSLEVKFEKIHLKVEIIPHIHYGEITGMDLICVYHQDVLVAVDTEDGIWINNSVTQKQVGEWLDKVQSINGKFNEAYYSLLDDTEKEYLGAVWDVTSSVTLWTKRLKINKAKVLSKKQINKIVESIADETQKDRMGWKD
jgi:hypothetical protein